MQNLNIAMGQIEGILKMIEDGRYCVDISNQIIVVQSLLKNLNMLILKQGINHCVKDAFLHDTGEAKADEVMDVLEKFIGR